MNTILVIVNLLKAAHLALQVYVIRETRREEDELLADEQRLNQLRDEAAKAPDAVTAAAATLAADRLRARIARSRGIVSRVVDALPAADPAAQAGAGSADQGREIRPGQG